MLIPSSATLVAYLLWETFPVSVVPFVVKYSGCRFVVCSESCTECVVVIAVIKDWCICSCCQHVDLR